MIENLLRVGPCPQTEVTLTDIKVHCTEVRFARLITTIVVNPPEKKMTKHTSVRRSAAAGTGLQLLLQQGSRTVLENGFWVVATTEIASLKPLTILTF